MVFLTSGARATGYPRAEEWSATPTSPHTHYLNKNGSKGLHVKNQAMRLLEYTDIYLHELGLCNISLNITWKRKATKEKMDTSDFLTLIIFRSSKDSIKKVKRQLHELKTYLQIMHLINIWHLQYLKQCCHSIIKRQVTQQWQIWIDISPKNTQRANEHRKDAQGH